MVRPAFWIVALVSGLTAGCAAFLDYDGLTDGRPGGDAGAGPPASDGAADASRGRDDGADATPDTAATIVESPDAPSAVSAAEASTGPDASVDSPGAADAAAGLDATTGADPCAAVSSVANGHFCGSETQWGFDPSAADPNTLYTCSDGRTEATTVCPHGCTMNQFFMDDSCNP
jgi:hypothetical protein